MLNDEDELYWLALRNIPGLGPVALRKKWEKLIEAKSIWQSCDLSQSDADKFLTMAQKEQEAMANFGARLVTINQAEYPNLMRHVLDITPVLYVKGKLLTDDEHSVGIVGTRRPSPYGVEVTEKLTRQLVAAGYTIVSGMAKGIDAVAHRTAIEAGGRTIAVWGSGLDMVYPSEHKKLAELILQHGAIVSQFPLGVEAQSYTFPARNKIIAGLSKAIIVTEAQAKSGSLLTAEAGLKYDRLVGAVPGSIFNVSSAGAHKLIKHGAKLVVDAADIVDTTNSTRLENHPPVMLATAPEQAILNLLQSGPQHIDSIIRQASQPASVVVSILAMLEIKGLVKQLAPGEYLVN